MTDVIVAAARASTGRERRNRYPDYSLRHHYALTDREREMGTIARSRVFDLVSDTQNQLVGFVEGTLEPGSFLVCGFWNRRASHGLGLWGLGQRQSGELDCARWHWYRLTERKQIFGKQELRRVLRRRLMAFPADLHGFRVDDVRGLQRLRAARTLYE